MSLRVSVMPPSICNDDDTNPSGISSSNPKSANDQVCYGYNLTFCPSLASNQLAQGALSALNRPAEPFSFL